MTQIRVAAAQAHPFWLDAAATTEKILGFIQQAADGSWVIAPTTDEERLLVTDIDRDSVHRARQTFDPAGHYTRPDVFDLQMNRRRLNVVTSEDLAGGFG